MLELSAKPAINSFAHPAGGGRSHAARLSAYHSETSSERSLQHSVATRFSDAATKAQSLYSVVAGYEGNAVRADSSRLQGLAALPGVGAGHRLTPLPTKKAGTVPLIGAPPARQ